MKRAIVLAVMMLGGAAASAQPVPTFSGAQRAALAQQQSQMRVNVGFNIFVQSPTGLSDQAMQAQERARRQMYELAKKECAVLEDVIASDCRIESVNVNINRHHSGGNQPEGFNVSANMVFRVTQK
jgi:hypothetical protein